MKKYSIFLVLLVLITAACNKVEFKEEDPNNFSNATSELMVSSPMLANVLVAEGELARMANIFTNQFTGAARQYLSLNQYNVASGDFNNAWGSLYADGVASAMTIRKAAVKEKKPIIEGIMMITEASLIGMATSLWGDVPFSQAGDVEKYPEPKYDSQTDIYNSLQKLLDGAIAKVGDEPGFGGKDYAAATLSQEHGPNMTWKKAAYSLKARYYLHTADYAKALAAARMGITNANESWYFDHKGAAYPNNVGTAQNIYWDFCVWDRDGYMGAKDAYLVQLLQDRSDAARLGYFYLPPGYWNADYYPGVWGGAIFDAGNDFPIISYIENELIIAECELLANNDADAAIAALNNVRAYWANRVGGTYPAFTAADFATNADLLKEILTEKYISTYGQLEAFNDMRRTKNYINIALKPGKTKYPERFLYPQSEINSNNNVPKIVDIYVPVPMFDKAYNGAK